MIKNYHHVFFVAFVFLASSCGVAQVISPTATSTLIPTPAPTQTPTPLSEIPFGVTYEGSLWRATLTDMQEIDEMEMMMGLVVKPNSPDRWVCVMLKLENPNDTEMEKIFSPQSITSITKDGDEVPLSGIILSKSLSGDTVNGFVQGIFAGNLDLSQEGVDAMSFIGSGDEFSMDYSLEGGQSGQFGLLFTVLPSDEIQGVNLGEDSPIMLTN